MNRTPHGAHRSPHPTAIATRMVLAGAVVLLLVPMQTGNAQIGSRQPTNPQPLNTPAPPPDVSQPAPSPGAESRVPDESPQTAAPTVAPNNPQPNVPPPAVSGSNIRNVAPDIYYLRDSSGSLVPVPLQLTFEEFAELYDLKHGLTQTAATPDFTIERLSATGSVIEDRANLDILLSIRTRHDGWVRVPLELGTAVTREPVAWPHKTDPLKKTDVIVTFDRGRQGYVAWLRTVEPGLIELPLKVSFSIERTGGQSRLRMNLPRATYSLITLEIDRKNVSGRVSDGAMFLPPRQSEKDGTTFRVQGAHGPSEIAWGPTTSESDETSSLIEVQGQLLVQVRGIDAVTTDARFLARSHGRPLESLRIRLPRNMTLASGDQPQYTVGVLELEPGKPIGSVGPLVEIKMREPTSDSVDIRLITEWSRPATMDRAPLDVADFRVLEAVRHYGHIALVAEGEWLVNWESSSNVRRVAKLPEGLATENLVAGFAYDRQPCSLPISIDRKKTYLNAEPSFRFDVSSDRVEMTGEFLINVRGAPAAQFSIHLPLWQVEDVSAEGIVKGDELQLDQVTPLRIPLVRPISGRVKLTVRAVRLLEPDLSRLDLDIPYLAKARLSPPLLIVVPADNVALQSRADADAYLTPEEFPRGEQFSSQQQQPLAYRYRGPADEARLQYNFSLKPQSITCDVDTRISLSPTRTVVRQMLRYLIRNKPLGALRLRSGAAIPDQQLTVRIDGRKQSLIADDSFITDPLERGFRLTLPQPLIGPIELDVSIPTDGWESERKGDAIGGLGVPLIMPADGQIQTNRAAIVASPDVSVIWNDDRWQRETGDNRKAEVDPSDLVLLSDQRITGLDLTIGTLASTNRSPTIVQRAFFQTWLTAKGRQDRAVFKLMTDSPRWRIIPPPGVLANQIQILVNGRLADPYDEDNGVVVVDNPTAGTQAAVQLEIVTPFTHRPERGAFTVRLPHIEGVTHIQKYFWQLVTPNNEHVLTSPNEVTREERWSWRGWTWGRRNRYTQTELETWSGGSHQQPPAVANNEYLMSGFGLPEPLAIRTVSRRLGLSVIGSGILLAGLALMFVPPLRHPVVLLILAVGVLVFGAWKPQLALLIAQVGGATVILLVLAKVLDWMTIRRRPAFIPKTISRPDSDSASTRIIRPSQPDDHQATMTSSSTGSKWSHSSTNQLED